MARGYEDLSRRALINLGHDFDDANDAELMQFLAENDDKYEGIRPVEKIIARADQLKDSAADCAAEVRGSIRNAADKLLDNVSDTLASLVNKEGDSKVISMEDTDNG